MHWADSGGATYDAQVARSDDLQGQYGGHHVAFVEGSGIYLTFESRHQQVGKAGHWQFMGWFVQYALAAAFHENVFTALAG